MKSIFKIALIASLFVIGLPTIEAQKSLEEAHVEYEVTNIEAESMEAQMMKGTLINIFFNKANSKMNVQMMGGMVTMDILTETASENTTLLMNMMGRKVKVKKDAEETEEEAGKPDFDITYDKADTKKIAGYDCIKAILTDKETKESIKMYITESLAPSVALLDEMFPGIKGLPMEIMISSQGMGATITALNVKKSVDKTAFDIPEGYEEMTPEQFQKEMGNMGNMGF